MQKETTHSWYTSWFDTPFYHILYKDRDHNEAQAFMQRLTDFLKLQSGDTILDLACGKGRHAISLNKMGFNVTGVDLSESSIEYASQFETQTLHFEVHDMCVPYPKQFDAVFNLFTSFGYFENDEDNLRTLKAIKSELKPSGHGVIDFMNVDFVVAQLVPTETKTVEGIKFEIRRELKNGYIYKTICFEHEETSYRFIERVKLLRLTDFKHFLAEANLDLKHCFGSYDLEDFDPKNSERLILIFT